MRAETTPAVEPPARRSVELRERALGPDHPVVAADLAALAALVAAQGRHPEAEAMYLRALNVFERVYGPGHWGRTTNHILLRCAGSRPRTDKRRAAPVTSERASCLIFRRRRT